MDVKSDKKLLLWCSVFTSVVLIKKKNILVKSNLREKGFVLVHKTRLQSVIVGKLRQKLQTAGHSTFAVKNRHKGMSAYLLACL